MRARQSLFVILSPILLLTSLNSYAKSGLNQLHSVLASLESKDEIKVELTTHLSRFRDEEELKEGHVSVILEDGINGFSLGYRPAVLAKIAQEQQAELEQKKLVKQGVNITEPVATPTIMAMSFLRPIQMRNFISKAQGLKKFIGQLTFIDETPENTQVGEFSILSFSVDMETIVSDKKAREYVDDFEGYYRLWITPKGVPVKAELSYQGSGTAYLIFSLEVEQIITESYQVVGDRLIVKEHYTNNKNTHSFGSMHFETKKAVKVLTPKAAMKQQGSNLAAVLN